METPTAGAATAVTALYGSMIAGEAAAAAEIFAGCMACGVLGDTPGFLARAAAVGAASASVAAGTSGGCSDDGWLGIGDEDTASTVASSSKVDEPLLTAARSALLERKLPAPSGPET